MPIRFAVNQSDAPIKIGKAESANNAYLRNVNAGIESLLGYAIKSLGGLTLGSLQCLYGQRIKTCGD